jgi:hypothetical protein
LSYICGDIVTRVQQRVRDTGFSSTEIKAYLNDTQNDVYNEYRLPFMQTTQDYTLTVGVADITNGSGLPANYVQAIDLLLTTTGSEKVLTYRDIREIDALYPDYENSTLYPNNMPSEWYLYAQLPKVFPKPNLAYTATLRYYKKPTLLSGDGDIPSLPSEFEELLVVGAAYRVLQVKDNYDQAGILQNKYDEILQKLVMKYSQPQVGSPTIMRINRRGLGKTSY